MNVQAFVIMGPMGCGKTEIGSLLAETLDWIFIDADDYHPAENVSKMSRGIPLTDDDRLPWLKLLHQMIQESLARGENCIIACSALRQIYRETLGIDQAQIVSVYLKGTPELLRQRLQQRTHAYMNNNLLNSQFAALEEPQGGITVDVVAAPKDIVTAILNQAGLSGRSRPENETCDIGLAGLAVMGENLALNMASRNFNVSVYDRFPEVTDSFIKKRASGTKILGNDNIESFVASLAKPRKIMMMIRAGDPVDEFIEQLLPYLEAGDIIIDGGNSNHQDSLRRWQYLEAKGLRFIGSGVSGGEIGALHGPSLMPGGSQSAWPHLKPFFEAIAAKADDGTPCCAWIGQGGAGHFVKMVHNGIEYGDMQLISEAYQVMKVMLDMSADQIQTVFAAWNKSELSSYLIEISADIMGYKDDDGLPLIDKILDVAGQKGTGKWTAHAALDAGVPLSLISESVFARCLSSNKEMRLAAEQTLNGPKGNKAVDRDALLADLGKALYAAKIISYTQGFGLLHAAAQEYGWQLDYARIAQIWRGGCIIRSAFLDNIAEAFSKKQDLANLLFDSYFTDQIVSNQDSLRRIVSAAVMSGIALPCHGSALSYFDGLRNGSSPANLLQAQRDYFGAHMYERTDKPRGEWFHTNWTGAGGETTSTAYTK